MNAPSSAQGIINHIALVLDSSTSMTNRANDLVRVADNQIAYLARRSKELDQETRITVYTFADNVECAVYDKDVLRLPSIKDYYKVGGWTALIDATLKSQEDLALTPEIYGDHAFLSFIVTDGEENRSRRRAAELTQLLNNQPGHWTVAVLVPDARGKHEAKRFGFPADNIAIWDATTVEGVTEAGETIRRATDTYMTNRSSGVRGTKSLFSIGSDVVNSQTIAAAGLKPLDTRKYRLVPVDKDGIQVRDFVNGCGITFRVGTAFYELMKPEKIQATKEIAIVEKSTDRVFVGKGAREMLGLPDTEVRVKPDHNALYRVHVQSNSLNRKLIIGTRLLVLV